jgi:hypothetical protein
MQDHVARPAGPGAAILVVEQHAREALAIADWAYVMASGRVVLPISIERRLLDFSTHYCKRLQKQEAKTREHRHSQVYLQ